VKTARVAASLAVLLSAFVLAPAATAGDGGGGGPLDPYCVTRAEFSKVETGERTGTPRLRVHRIFGTRGARVGEGEGYVTRGYDRCGHRRRDTVIIDYTTSGSRQRAIFKAYADLP
jgi:hypothetical protein